MTEAIIGREEGKHRLLVKVGQKGFTVGEENSVPRTVSRTHCKVILNADCVKVINLKSESCIYVDGQEVESKTISEESRLQLGEDRYDIDLKYIISCIRKITGVSTSESQSFSEEFSLQPLKQIWDEYETTRLEMQLAEHKKKNIEKLGGICSSCGVLFYFFEGMGNLRFVLTGASILIALIFFIRGMNTSSSLVLRLNKLDKDFWKRYVCPNPKCHIFVGNIPFDLLSSRKRCPNCGCKYKK